MTDDGDGSDGFESDWEAAAEWGLASLIVGAVSVVAALLGLLLVLLTRADFDNRGWNDAGMMTAALMGYLGWLALVAVTVAGLRFGRWSMAAARRRGQPIARGLAGVLLNAAGLFAAVGVGLAWTGALLDELW